MRLLQSLCWRSLGRGGGRCRRCVGVLAVSGKDANFAAKLMIVVEDDVVDGKHFGQANRWRVRGPIARMVIGIDLLGGRGSVPMKQHRLGTGDGGAFDGADAGFPSD